MAAEMIPAVEDAKLLLGLCDERRAPAQKACEWTKVTDPEVVVGFAADVLSTFEETEEGREACRIRDEEYADDDEEEEDGEDVMQLLVCHGNYFLADGVMKSGDAGEGRILPLFKDRHAVSMISEGDAIWDLVDREDPAVVVTPDTAPPTLDDHNDELKCPRCGPYLRKRSSKEPATSNPEDRLYDRRRGAARYDDAYHAFAPRRRLSHRERMQAMSWTGAMIRSRRPAKVNQATEDNDDVLSNGNGDSEFIPRTGVIPEDDCGNIDLDSNDAPTGLPTPPPSPSGSKGKALKASTPRKRKAPQPAAATTGSANKKRKAVASAPKPKTPELVLQIPAVARVTGTEPQVKNKLRRSQRERKLPSKLRDSINLDDL